MQKQRLKGLPELLRHATVDGKIERICTDNEEIDQGNDEIQYIVANYQRPVHHILCHVEYGGNGQGYLHDQEYGDHDEQHQGSTVTVSQFLVLCFPILFEQFGALLARIPHGLK